MTGNVLTSVDRILLTGIIGAALFLTGCRSGAPLETLDEEDTTSDSQRDVVLSTAGVDEAIADYHRREEAWSDLRREFAEEPVGFRANPKLWSQWVETCLVLGEPVELATPRTIQGGQTAPVESEQSKPIDRSILQAKLDLASRLLAEDANRFRGLDILSQVVLNENVPADLRAESDRLFDLQTDLISQKWLLKQCEAHVGQFAVAYPGWGTITVMELWCLWHAYTAIGDQTTATAWLNEAFQSANRSEKSSTAANAGATLAGALFHLKHDAEARRAIDIAATGMESGDYQNAYIYCCIGAISYLMGDHEKAEHFRLRARKGQRSSTYTDAMYFALCRRIKEARAQVDRQASHKALAVLSLCAAAEGQLDESTSAKRQLLQWIERDSRDFTDEKFILVWADAVAGRFEMAERRAFNLPTGYPKSCAYSAIADEYTRLGDPDTAHEFMSHGTMTYGTPETGFYLARSWIRRHPSMSAMYRWACSSGSNSYRLTLLCGAVAGFHPDLPTRSIRNITGK